MKILTHFLFVLFFTTAFRPISAQVVRETIVTGALVHDYRGLESAAQGRFVEAFKEFRAALSYMPWFARSMVHAQVARDVLDNTIPRRFALQLFRAQNQLTNADSADAATLATKAIVENSEYVPGYLLRGLIYEDLGEREKARLDYDEVIKRWPQYSLSYYLRGKLSALKKEWPDAISDFSKMIDIDNTFALAYLQRGIAYTALKQFNKAVLDFEVAIKARPKWQKDFNVFSAYLNRGMQYNEAGRYPEALKDLERAVNLNPKFSEAYLNRGITLLNMGNYDAAIADFSIVLKREPNSYEASYHRGICYKQKKEFASAIQDFKSVLLNHPEYLQAHFRLGEIYAKQGEHEKAVVEFEKTTDLDATNFWAYYQKAIVLDKLKRRKSALAAYQDFLKTAPFEHESHRNFARDRISKLKRYIAKGI